jgi:hypothetical protein
LLLAYSSDIAAEMIFSPSHITPLRIHMPVTPPQNVNIQRF